MSFLDLFPSPALIAAGLDRRRLRAGFRALYHKYRNHTLVHEAMYVDNLDSAPGPPQRPAAWSSAEYGVEE